MKKRGFFPLFLLSAAILLPALTACRQGFAGDPRLYNKIHSNTYISDISLPEPQYDADADPFKKAEENGIGPDYGGFSASWFDDRWVLPKMSFDGNNIPVCRFDSRLTGWKTEYRPTEEYSYNANDEGNTALAGLSIRPMQIYQYRGKNPLASPYCPYNSSENIKRFRFYRFVGKAIGSISLDQFVIAVDTYSKFVFAYAAVTELNNFSIPQEYEPVELHSEDGRPFYEYDPIGYVQEDGTVVRYRQYEEDMETDRAVNYLPRIHSPAEYPDFPETVARHDPEGQGRSPYYPGLYAGQTQTP